MNACTVLDDCQWQLLYSHSIHGVMAVCVVLAALQKGMYMNTFYKLIVQLRTVLFHIKLWVRPASS